MYDRRLVVEIAEDVETGAFLGRAFHLCDPSASRVQCRPEEVVNLFWAAADMILSSGQWPAPIYKAARHAVASMEEVTVPAAVRQ